MDRRFATVTLLLSFTWPVPSSAQSLASRLDRIRDGAIRVSFATRAGVCGDGRFIGEETPDVFRMYVFRGNGFSTQTLEHVRPTCEAGPLRLVIEKAGGRVRELSAAVGVQWREGDAVDLGTVSAPEAAAWLLDLAPRLDEGGDVRVALLAAAMADSARIAGRLIALARDADAPRHVRDQAMRWLVRAGEREGLADRVDETLRGIAVDGSEPSAIRQRAIRSLPETPSNDRFLRSAYGRTAEVSLRERILRRLGESKTDENAHWIREVALDGGQPLSLRERAVRVIGEMGRPADVRALYARLDDPLLKERALRVVGQHDGGSIEWVRNVAVSTAEPAEVRERAVRILAGRGVETAALSRLYDRVDSRAVRERLIRIFGERRDRAAIAKLEAIAERDPDPALRRSASRRLGSR